MIIHHQAIIIVFHTVYIYVLFVSTDESAKNSISRHLLSADSN